MKPITEFFNVDKFLEVRKTMSNSVPVERRFSFSKRDIFVAKCFRNLAGRFFKISYIVDGWQYSEEGSSLNRTFVYCELMYTKCTIFTQNKEVILGAVIKNFDSKFHDGGVIQFSYIDHQNQFKDLVLTENQLRSVEVGEITEADMEEVRKIFSEQTTDTKKITDMKEEIVKILLQYFSHIGMDRPSNLDEIVDFIAEDIKETADVENWNSSDVSIGLRRWIESKI